MGKTIYWLFKRKELIFMDISRNILFLGEIYDEFSNRCITNYISRNFDKFLPELLKKNNMFFNDDYTILDYLKALIKSERDNDYGTNLANLANIKKSSISILLEKMDALIEDIRYIASFNVTDLHSVPPIFKPIRKQCRYSDEYIIELAGGESAIPSGMDKETFVKDARAILSPLNSAATAMISDLYNIDNIDESDANLCLLIRYERMDILTYGSKIGSAMYTDLTEQQHKLMYNYFKDEFDSMFKNVYKQVRKIEELITNISKVLEEPIPIDVKRSIDRIAIKSERMCV